MTPMEKKNTNHKLGEDIGITHNQPSVSIRIQKALLSTNKHRK